MHTQKNLVGVRSIRRSLKDELLGEDRPPETSHIGAMGSLPPVNLPAHIRMNRTSAMAGFGDHSQPVRLQNAFATASSKFNL